MLPLRKKISDLKSRPLNWDRVSYVLSKNEYFLSTWGDVMSRKNGSQKVWMRGNSYNKKVQFREVSQKWQKNDCIKAKKGPKKAVFGDQKKRDKIDVSYRSSSGAGRHFENSSLVHFW